MEVCVREEKDAYHRKNKKSYKVNNLVLKVKKRVVRTERRVKYVLYRFGDDL